MSIHDWETTQYGMHDAERPLWVPHDFSTKRVILIYACRPVHSAAECVCVLPMLKTWNPFKLMRTPTHF